MDDKKVMKKNSFMAGAFVSTLGIIISKFLGIIYVIAQATTIKGEFILHRRIYYSH